MACGGGTYIRSIVRDIGDVLGCGGLVETLIRTQIGAFTLDEAIDPAILTRESLPVHLRSPLEAVPDLPRIGLDETQVAEIGQGRPLDMARLSTSAPAPGMTALLGPDGSLVAIGEVDPDGKIRPRKVLA